jgi:hypothetical protein
MVILGALKGTVFLSIMHKNKGCCCEHVPHF